MILRLNKNLLNISTSDLLISILLALLCALVMPFGIYIIFIVILGLVIFKYGQNAVMILIIVSMVAATGPALESYRNIFSFITISLLIYIFFKQKGFNFKEYRIPPKEINFLVLFIIMSIVISSLNSGLRPLSILAILRTLIFFGICYLLFSNLEDRKFIKIYFLALIIASLIVSFTVYYDMINAGLTLYVVQGVLARYSGIYGNPNYVGLLLSITTIILIVYLFSENISSSIRKIIIPIILFSNMAAILITNSRSAIAGTIISIGFILFNLNKSLFKKSLIISTAIFIILISIPSVVDFYNAFVRIGTVNERSVHWAAGWDMMIDHFIFGIGPENFQSKFFNYVPSSAWNFYEVDTSIFKFHPHNYFLLMISENGILGILFSVFIFFIYFRLSWRVMKSSKSLNREEFLMSTALFSIGIVLFIRAFFEVDGVFSYGYITRDLPFWICYIITAHLYSKNNVLILR